MAPRVWLSHLKPQASRLCSASLAAQFFLLTIQFLIHQLDTSWFATNKVRGMLQPVTHKFLVALEFALQHLVRVQPT
jgi:hypothetical protein